MLTATIAQPQQTEVQSPIADIDEVILDDLATLSDRIQSLLKAVESGEDATQAYAKVQSLTKAMAVEFGMIREVFENNDRLLAQSGLKNQLVAI